MEKSGDRRSPLGFANDFLKFIVGYALDLWLKDSVIEYLASKDVI